MARCPSHDWDDYCKAQERSMQPEEPEPPHQCELVEWGGQRFCGICGCDMDRMEAERRK